MNREPLSDRQYAYLGIRGVGDVSRITKILGIEPDECWSQGDPWHAPGPHDARTFTHWKLNSGCSDEDDLNVHVRAVLAQLRGRDLALQSLSGEYDLRIVFASFNRQCFSFELEFELQRRLTHLGIRMWFDAYCERDVHQLMFDAMSRLGNDFFKPE